MLETDRPFPTKSFGVYPIRLQTSGDEGNLTRGDADNECIDAKRLKDVRLSCRALHPKRALLWPYFLKPGRNGGVVGKMVSSKNPVIDR